MAEFILSSEEKINRFETSKQLLWPNGKALAPGERFRNPELAAALRRIAEQGAAGFYQGETARRVVARIYMIVRRGGRWTAVADPRHNGEARGY